MTKILFLTPYPTNSAPSQRFRFEQYFSFFKDENIDYDTLSFLDEATWKIFYQKGFLLKKTLGILKGLLNRHLLLLKIHQYDKLFIHREAAMIGPAYFEWIYSKLFKKEIIFDFDDAIWLKDVSNANQNLSWLKFPDKTKSIIAYSKTIIAGNTFLSNYAKQFNANVYVIPTTIDTNYHYPSKKTISDTIKIGWTGSSTTNKHLELISDVLQHITQTYSNVKIIMISNQPIISSKFRLKFVEWKQSSEIEDLSQIDIGIMPLPDNEWAKGKCGFKGLQYMALEIPTIMSPVGVNTEMIQDRKNGFLASNKNEWISKLSALIESKELRESLGKNGRKTIEKKYSITNHKDFLISLLKH